MIHRMMSKEREKLAMRIVRTARVSLFKFMHNDVIDVIIIVNENVRNEKYSRARRVTIEIRVGHAKKLIGSCNMASGE